MILRSTYLHLTGIIVLFEHLFKLSFSCFYDKCWPAPSPEPSTIYLCSRILDPGILHILIDLLEEKLPFREKIKCAPASKPSKPPESSGRGLEVTQTSCSLWTLSFVNVALFIWSQPRHSTLIPPLIVTCNFVSCFFIIIFHEFATKYEKSFLTKL